MRYLDVVSKLGTPTNLLDMIENQEIWRKMEFSTHQPPFLGNWFVSKNLPSWQLPFLNRANAHVFEKNTLWLERYV